MGLFYGLSTAIAKPGTPAELQLFPAINQTKKELHLHMINILKRLGDQRLVLTNNF